MEEILKTTSEVVSVVASTFTFAVFLAVLVEGIAELISNTLERLKVPKEVSGTWMPWVAILIGVGGAFASGLDLLNAVAEMFEMHVNYYVAVLMSGVIIGRGSSYVHDVWALVVSFRRPKVDVINDYQILETSGMAYDDETVTMTGA